MDPAVAKIAGVVPGSIADELELEPGDAIIKINGHPVTDLVDFQYFGADEHLEIAVSKRNGEYWLLDVEKEYDETLGIEFNDAVFDQVRRCQNRCVFCFVDQMPEGLRATLYQKDDDYRLSFLQGNFITLSNLSEDDIARIRTLKLSPLYVSVHATDPKVRTELFRNRAAGRVMEQLTALTASGIDIHAQLVLCPEINDGIVLEQSLTDLSGLWPHLRSVGVVPVGLTRFRDSLHPLRPFTPVEAAQVVETVTRCHRACRRKFDYGFCFAADEFFLLAGKPFPKRGYYEDFPQTENGVGLARLFWDDFRLLQGKLPQAVPAPRRVAVVTGVDGYKVIEQVVARLAAIEGISLTPVVVHNRFFGSSITVTGLITGGDLLRELKEVPAGTAVLVPDVMLKHGDDRFLDGTTVSELEAATGLTVTVVPAGAGELVAAILGKGVASCPSRW